MRSLLEGSPGSGVSGPSADLAMVLSLISELSGLASVFCSFHGSIGVKLDVGLVGGLGGYGTQTGKIVGFLKSRLVNGLILQLANFESASDEMQIIAEEVTLHSIRTLT